MDRMRFIRNNAVFILTAIAFIFVTPSNGVPQFVEASRGVRIVGPTEGAGRVEVLVKGQWGTVCDDGFDLIDAGVVCRLLGFESAIEAVPNSWYGQGSGNIWMSNVDCKGREARLSLCRHTKRHRCSHREDVGVTCRGRQSDPKEHEWSESRDFGVRLKGSSKPRTGYVEVGFGGRWGTVCPDGWGSREARVVCGQMGYRKGRPRLYVGSKSWNKSSKKPITTTSTNVTENALMADINCNGLEINLALCSHAGFGRHRCRSPGIAGVLCWRPSKSLGTLKHQLWGDKQVRLRGSALPWEGRVEVFWNNEWHKVCDRGWDVQDASVVCRQLGYGSAYEAVTRSRGFFGQGFTRILMNNVRCKGNEPKLLDCQYDDTFRQSCRHWENAGVRCNPPPVNHIPARLIGGGENDGRVEMLQSTSSRTRWVAVCGDGWNEEAAAVVCRQLRLGFALENGKGGKYGNGVEYLVMNVLCNGDEDSLEHCQQGGVASVLSGTCRSGAAYVVCSKYLADLIPNFKSTEDSLNEHSVSFVRLSELTCAWEENCLSKSAAQYMAEGQHMEEARQFHSRRLLRFSVQVFNFGTRDFLPIVDRKDWIWHSCHRHYHSFENFATYDLINSSSGKSVAEGHKASFCLEDGHCVEGGQKEYLCADNHQGISVNCADTYNFNIDCQWIDISDVSYGNYTLVVTVNPSHLVAEMDYSNNVLKCSMQFYPTAVHQEGTMHKVQCQMG